MLCCCVGYLSPEGRRRRKATKKQGASNLYIARKICLFLLKSSEKRKKNIYRMDYDHMNIPTPLIAILNIEFERKKLFKALHVDKRLIFHGFFFFVSFMSIKSMIL